MKKILFFTPYAERHGSEMLLLNILKGFDRNVLQAQLICEQSGELLKSLPADVKSYALKYSFLERAKFKASTIRKPDENFLPISAYINQITSIHNRFQPDYWYFNTIVMAKMIPLAKKLGAKVISHFHELPPYYQTIGENQLKDLIEYSTATIGCSETVCEKLRILGHKNIHLQYEFIDGSKVITQNKKSKQIRQELNIGSEDFVWVLSGSLLYNKGIDFLPEIAKHFCNKKVHFLWLGGGSGGLFYYIKKQLEYYGIDNVHFPGALKEDYYDYLAAGDGFLLLSRSDSFPLVMIEAACLGKPIIAFNSGGVKEFVLEGMGTVVHSWNISDLVNEMNKLMSGAIKIDTAVLTRRAAEFCVSNQIINWQNIINNIINSSN